MTRYGILHARPEGLLIGDPGREHLLLTPQALIARDHRTVTDEIAWERISAVRLDVPTSRFRFTGAAVGVASAVLAFFISGDPGMDPEDGRAHVTTPEGEIRLWVGRHHVGGYWVRNIEASQRLIDRLIDEPYSRALLWQPDALLEAVRKAARRGA